MDHHNIARSSQNRPHARTRFLLKSNESHRFVQQSFWDTMNAIERLTSTLLVQMVDKKTGLRSASTSFGDPPRLFYSVDELTARNPVRVRMFNPG